MPTTPSEIDLPPSPTSSAADGDVAQPRQAVTELLRAWSTGDAYALEALVPLVYDELRRQARQALGREGAGHTLQATALVHEAWLRLCEQHGARWESRTQFFAISAQVMRRVLVDHARTRHALKRGGGAVQVSLGDADRAGAALGAGGADGSSVDAVDVLALDTALARLATLDPEKARLVDLRYFAGLSIPEAAAALGVSPATVSREWAIARMWLRRELES
jgi:RNA polymerase sigma factor (TIGR02999 family)